MIGLDHPNMLFFAGLIVGLFSGAALGLIIAGLCRAAADADRALESQQARFHASREVPHA